MQIQLSGQHIEITPALRQYVTEKLERLARHFDQVGNVHVVLSVEKLCSNSIIRLVNKR